MLGASLQKPPRVYSFSMRPQATDEVQQRTTTANENVNLMFPPLDALGSGRTDGLQVAIRAFLRWAVSQTLLRPAGNTGGIARAACFDYHSPLRTVRPC